MNYNSLMNKPTINYRELIGDNTVTEVGGITEEQFNTLLNTDLSSYYTKAQIDDLFSRSYVYREKSDSIVTFDCPSSKNGISEVTSEIVAVQSGTGDPSPTNVRPISGFSAVDVTRCGKNFFKVGSLINQTTAGVTYTSDDNHLIMNGTKSGGSNVTFQNFSITLKAGTYYVKLFAISGSVSKINQSFNLMEGNTSIVAFDLSREYSFVLTEDKTLNLRTTIWEDGIVYTDYTLGIVISNTPNIEQFVPYNGTTYTTTLKDGQGNPMTCYGGTLSNENGVQRLDNTHNSFDMGSVSWSYYNLRFFTKIDDIWINEQAIVPTDNQLMCEIYKTVMYTNQLTGTVATWNGYIYVKDDSYNGDITAFRTAVTGYKIAYEKATPQTIPQDNLAIASQDGTNNLWTDSGDVTVKALDKIIQG